MSDTHNTPQDLEVGPSEKAIVDLHIKIPNTLHVKLKQHVISNDHKTITHFVLHALKEQLTRETDELQPELPQRQRRTRTHSRESA